MSILINGMELPREDGAIVIYKIGGKFFAQRGRADKLCHLIEVPEPHGRLIDADEMFVEFVMEGQRSKRYKIGEKWELNGEEIRSVISRLPTIIPASEKE